MKFEKEHAIRLICPFAPWINSGGRSYTCVADRCIMWKWDGRKKASDEDDLKRVGHCTLQNDSGK